MSNVATISEKKKITITLTLNREEQEKLERVLLVDPKYKYKRNRSAVFKYFLNTWEVNMQFARMKLPADLKHLNNWEVGDLISRTIRKINEEVARKLHPSCRIIEFPYKDQENGKYI